MDTFSKLYLEEEREGRTESPDQRIEHDKTGELPLPPPPLDFQEEELQVGSNESVQRMICILKHRIGDFRH